jgi:uncharacterized membrane protein
MNTKRILRHLLTSDISLRKKFSPAVMKSIESAIAESEKLHSGEIRFAVENTLELFPLLKGVSARDRAIAVFSELGIWDTEQNNGVLIYLLLADHDVEIIADRGVNKKVSMDEWETICKQMEDTFRRGEFEQGVKNGIRSISKYLESYFPPDGHDRNELPDKPVII